MSSSPSRAAAPLEGAEIAHTAVHGAVPEAVPFPYGEAVLRPGQRNFPLAEHNPLAAAAAERAASAPDPQRDAQMRETGRQQGFAEARAKFEEQLAQERAAVAKALGDFSRERGEYYRKIEQEAVQLAMAIARKVIHREAQVDPLLLMGIVRVALERMEGATGVVLEVHPEQVPEWRRYLAARLGAEDLPEIAENAALARERCVLRTSMGTAELGLELQLKEVEQGLMDLLAARPEKE
jgi:flagellar biosynthesis/type III secretory pathway protein FliH